MSTEAFISARLPSVNNTTSLPSESPALANQPGTHASSMDVDAHMYEHEASAVVNIQPDWYLVLREEEGKAWITVKERGQLGIHGYLLSQGESNEGGTYNIDADEDEFQLQRITSKSLELSHSKISAAKLILKLFAQKRSSKAFTRKI